MIGGADIVLAGRREDGEGPFIVSWLLKLWPDLVVQDAASEGAVDPAPESIAAMTEFFVYRTRDDFESWMSEGASEANSDAMIHVILETASLTFVTATSEHGAETSALGFALRDAVLSRRILNQVRAHNATNQRPQAGSARRFRELVNDFLFELAALVEREHGINACWATMTVEERTEVERELLYEMPRRSTGIDLEDVLVQVGGKLAPTTRRDAA